MTWATAVSGRAHPKPVTSHFPHALPQITPPVKFLSAAADKESMYISPSLFSLFAVMLVGILVTLYIMRRRVRLGRRKGTF